MHYNKQHGMDYKIKKKNVVLTFITFNHCCFIFCCKDISIVHIPVYFTNEYNALFSVYTTTTKRNNTYQYTVINTN